jgi:hypothetical protein
MPLILGANSITGGYEVDNSLRFNDGSSDYLSKTLGAPTNNKKWTWSSWLKRSTISNDQHTFFSAGTDYNMLQFATADTIQIEFDDSDNYRVRTNRLFRDVSAWYHIVVAVDTTQSTASNRMKFYVNGVQETSFSTANYPPQNYDTPINSATEHNIGRRITDTSKFYDGYMSEVVFVDGQQLTPTDFGEFDEDSGIWKPIDVSGLTFGNNGFYLPFENSAALGQDDSGNGNNFTVNNLTSIDQTTDTPTNNYATLNPLVPQSTGAFSEGNCKNVSSTSTNFGAVSTMGVSSGKWYAEFIPVSATEEKKRLIGACGDITSNTGAVANIYMYGLNTTGDSGSEVVNTYENGTETDVTSTYTGYFENDIVGIALDLDNNKIYFSVNGTFENSSDPVAGTGGLSLGTSPPDGVFYFAVMDIRNADSITYEANFGNPPFTISTGNSDANGYGNFEYAVPSGYYALNSKNLAEYG